MEACDRKFFQYATAKQWMRTQKPAFIPRNQLVEQALDQAVNGNLVSLERLLEALSNPYEYRNKFAEFIKPPSMEYEMKYRTFCGT